MEMERFQKFKLRICLEILLLNFQLLTINLNKYLIKLIQIKVDLLIIHNLYQHLWINNYFKIKNSCNKHFNFLIKIRMDL